MRVIFTLLVSLLLVACSNSTGGSARTYQGGFDNARRVSVDPHGLQCGMSMVCGGLGAQWTSADPENVIVLVNIFNDYRAITGAALDIDGEKVALGDNQALTTFRAPTPGSAMRESRKAFNVPLTIVRRIPSANRVWVRIYTTDGYIDGAVIDGDRDSKAFHALKRFIASVDSI